MLFLQLPRHSAAQTVAAAATFCPVASVFLLAIFTCFPALCIEFHNFFAQCATQTMHLTQFCVKNNSFPFLQFN